MTAPRRRRRRLTGAEREKAIDRAVQLYIQGHSIRDVAKELGLSYGAVHWMLEHDERVVMRARGGRPGEVHNRRGRPRKAATKAQIRAAAAKKARERRRAKRAAAAAQAPKKATG